MKYEEIIPPKINRDRIDVVTKEDLLVRESSEKFFFDTYNFLVFDDTGAYTMTTFANGNVFMRPHQINCVTKYFSPFPNRKSFTYQTHYDAKKQMKVSEDKLSMSFGEGSRITYSEVNGCHSYRVVLHFDSSSKPGRAKGVAPASDDSVFMDLEFISEAGNGFKAGDGTTYYGEEKEMYVYHAFMLPRARVRGFMNVQLDGPSSPFTRVSLSGFGFATKSVTNVSPHKIATTFHHVKLITPELSMQLFATDTTKYYGHTRYVTGSLLMNDGRIAVMNDVKVNWEEMGDVDPETKYRIPTRIRYIWDGRTVDPTQPDGGEDVHMELLVHPRPEALLAKIDVLEHLPWFLRILVQKFIARPYMYQYLEDKIEATVKVGTTETVVRGVCLHETHFINP